MKYEIHINQRAIVENNFDLDIVEGAILDFCKYFSSSSSCRFMVEEGKRYYWFSHSIICNQLPVLRLKPDSAYRRMKKLCDKSFIEAHPKNKQMNSSWYAFMPTSDLLFASSGKKSEAPDSYPKGTSAVPPPPDPPTDESPMTTGCKSDPPTDESPMNKEIDNKEIDNNSNSEKENSESDRPSAITTVEENSPSQEESKPSLESEHSGVSNEVFRPGEVPPFVQAERDNIDSEKEAVPGEWCTIKRLPCSRPDMVRLIGQLFSGDKANVFRKQTGYHYSELQEGFIEDKAMSKDFDDRNHVFNTFRLYAKEVAEGKYGASGRKSPVAGAKASSDIKWGSYEVTLDD